MAEMRKVGVVVPCGPGGRAIDTLESILRYTPRPRTLVVVDDTDDPNFAHRVEAISEDVVCLPAPLETRLRRRGAVWVKVAVGLRHLIVHAEPTIILRLDDDALMIGPGSFEAAEACFDADARLGLLGAYRFSGHGNRRQFDWAAKRLRHETSLLGLRRPSLRRELSRLWVAADRHGYEPGEHVLGGAYFMAPRLAARLLEVGQLPHPALIDSRLAEDHLLGLVARSEGFSFGDLSRPDQILCLRHRGLPASPEELLARGKAIVHSVRSFEDRSEADIRAVFADARHRDSAGPGRAPEGVR